MPATYPELPTDPDTALNQADRVSVLYALAADDDYDVRELRREALRERALGVALRERYVPSALTCVLRLERAADAESLMLERFPGMGSRDADYAHLLQAAKLAAERGTALTEALCYRTRSAGISMKT